MARFVKIASVLFKTKRSGAADAREIVLRETAETLEDLKGYGLDLVVFCEGVEAYGQTIEQAEEVCAAGAAAAVVRRIRAGAAVPRGGVGEDPRERLRVQLDRVCRARRGGAAAATTRST